MWLLVVALRALRFLVLLIALEVQGMVQTRPEPSEGIQVLYSGSA